MFNLTIPGVLFFSAAVLCVLGVAAHELLGAPMVLGPLEASGLEDEVVWLHRFSWHVGTVAVIAMAGMFLLAIWHPAGTSFAVVASLMSAGFAACAVSLAVFGDPVMWSTPAPYPWTVVAILGFAGALVSRSPG